MTPEESQRLEACIQEAATILYRNTPKNELKTLESIEKTVREQIIQHLSPKIAPREFPDNTGQPSFGGSIGSMNSRVV